MSEEDRPLTARDFFKYMDNLNKTVKEEVHQEVTAAIAPFRDMQNEVVMDLAQTKDRVSTIEKVSNTTKATLAQLQAQVKDLQNGVQNPHSYSLSPTMKASIFKFLDCEMKVIIDSIVIRRIFPPAKQTEWDHLYVEFSDISTAKLNNYARNLCHGLSISIYVPHCLHPRRAAINNIAFGYRNGTIKHNSKIKYGASDFLLLIKEKGNRGPWSNVALDTESLPPPDFSSTATSPPRGRIRLPSKRARPSSDDASPKRAKARKEDIEKTGTKDISNDDNDRNDLLTDTNLPDEKATPKTPENLAPALASKKDLGAFLPSACLSPSFSLNQNFTFGADQSKVPMILSPLN